MSLFRAVVVFALLWLALLSGQQNANAANMCQSVLSPCATSCCPQPPQYRCPDGLVGYPGVPGLCLPPPRAPGCPEGYGVVALPVCPPGYFRDPSDLQNCLPDGLTASLPACPPGTHSEMTELGRLCLPNLLGECGSGLVRMLDGTCAPQGNWTGSYQWICLPECPEGTLRDYRRPFLCHPPLSLCPQGYELEDGRCLPDCLPGAIRDPSGNCTPPVACPPGSLSNYYGDCVPLEDNCPNGNPPFIDQDGNLRCDYDNRPQPQPAPQPEPQPDEPPTQPQPEPQPDEPPTQTQTEPEPDQPDTVVLRCPKGTIATGAVMNGRPVCLPMIKAKKCPKGQIEVRGPDGKLACLDPAIRICPPGEEYVISASGQGYCRPKAEQPKETEPKKENKPKETAPKETGEAPAPQQCRKTPKPGAGTCEPGSQPVWRDCQWQCAMDWNACGEGEVLRGDTCVPKGKVSLDNLACKPGFRLVNGKCKAITLQPLVPKLNLQQP